MIEERRQVAELLPSGQWIPRAQWSRFFEHVSQEHRGERVTFELARLEADGSPVVTCQAFRSIAADDQYGLSHITIVLSNAVGNATMHTVAKAANVRFTDACGSVPAALTISTTHGTVAALRFSQTAFPGQ